MAISLEPWTVLDSEPLIDYSPWLRVIRQDVQLPNGERIKDYLLTPARDYAMIVPITDTGEVVLVRQYKHGVERVVLDFPAGYLESPSEDSLAAAQRELREETGYTAREWTRLGAYALDTNRSRTSAHLFLARGLTRTHAQHLDATENLEFELHPVGAILPLMQSGLMPGIGCPAAWGLAQLVLRPLHDSSPR